MESGGPAFSHTETVRLSKQLSYILRHGAIKEKLQLTAEGYVRLDDLLARPKLKGVTFEAIDHVVRTNDKKRFQMKCEDDIWWIRATQGHSLRQLGNMDLILCTEALPIVVHGTYLERWSSIQRQGLKTMSRNHIHLAPGLPSDEGVISGMRTTSEVFIYIDMAKALADGIQFYRSVNNVILTQGQDGVLAPCYFERVVTRDGTLLA
ncbi:tRNA 2'-phosphotransferase 1 [Apophysomyces ossiformis]|uniref:2'-phosphotransferase n=1 Tax=Apophysomyces ossiformis TaxID=679940 RepID=A0A8H7ESG7_9FUNG|nr:tRNA 2'-phosphotransferase 1 [Apophysomyces ossiformis]